MTFRYLVLLNGLFKKQKIEMGKRFSSFFFYFWEKKGGRKEGWVVNEEGREGGEVKR